MTAPPDARAATVIEPAASPPTTLARVRADLDGVVAVNGLIGFVFAVTGPLAVILSVGRAGGLTEAQIASWVFGSYGLNGLITLFFCWRYRQPLALMWSIPGAVLVGPALGHLPFAQVAGAFVACGALMFALGLSGWVRRAMAAVPMPIVMGMVAAVFLRFGLDLVRALHGDAAIAVPMVATWLALHAWPAAGRRLPPMIGVLIVGALAVAASGRFAPELASTAVLARPILVAPDWSWQAMAELVLPLTIAVLVVQNGQGVAVLRSAGHDAPVNAVTVACGAMSALAGLVGSVSTCLTGPTNAIVSSAGPRERHYTGAIVVGVLATGFGLMSPLFTRLMLATPAAFIAVLAGLAMLRVLQGAFSGAFGGRFALGALVTFLVTVADRPILNVGAAFWGLVAGFAVSWLLERGDFAARER